jgi:putative membrane protein
MIVKRNLDPRRVVRYTAGPMAWATAWAVAAPAAYAITDDERLWLPFAPIATLGAALAIVIAFRNSSAVARWNEARIAWQNVLVASRVLIRQVVASTDNAVVGAAIGTDEAIEFRRDVGGHLIVFARLLADRTRPSHVAAGRTLRIEDLSPNLPPDGHPDGTLTSLAMRIKGGIRSGALGQFDPISTEPQLVALNAAQGVIERIATTPTPRQYDYFTRRTIQLFALLVPFGLLGLLPGVPWLVPPLALAVSGSFIVLAVTAAANDEPFAGAVTDVPIDAIVTQVEVDVATALELPQRPQPAAVADGYLW